MVGVPVGEGRDETDRVVTLAFPPGDRLLEADAGTGYHRFRRAASRPWQAPGRRGEPGVADQEERRAVGVLQCATVRGRAYEAAAVGIHPLFRLGPGDGTQPAASAVQAAVIGLVRTRPPVPVAGARRDEPDSERPSSVPETVYPAF